MSTALPQLISDYPIAAGTSTDDLLTLARCFNEVGAYASTILSCPTRSLACQCEKSLGKVTEELSKRNAMIPARDLPEPPCACTALPPSLASLSVSSLERLYRQAPIRRDKRRAQGREHLTYYIEHRIVRELQSRRHVTKSERLKIDYCLATYNNELDNLAFLLSRPVKADDNKLHPDSSRSYSPDELTALIGLYTDYRDIAEREALVEYVDFALDMLEQAADATFGLGLLTRIAEIGRRRILRVPDWVNERLETATQIAETHRETTDSELAMAMLAMQMVNGDPSLTRKAQKIINRCYQSAFDENTHLGNRIDCLHTVVTCCDYVARFSLRKVAALWNDLSRRLPASGLALTPRQLFRHLETAKELEDSSPISVKSKEALRQLLQAQASTGSAEPEALCRYAELKF